MHLNEMQMVKSSILASVHLEKTHKKLLPLKLVDRYEIMNSTL